MSECHRNDMDDAKVETQVKSAMDGDVSTGETMVLSKDEQHLAKLGYKQGVPFPFSEATLQSLTQKHQSSFAISDSLKTGQQHILR